MKYFFSCLLLIAVLSPIIATANTERPSLREIRERGLQTQQEIKENEARAREEALESKLTFSSSFGASFTYLKHWELEEYSHFLFDSIAEKVFNFYKYLAYFTQPERGYYESIILHPSDKKDEQGLVIAFIDLPTREDIIEPLQEINKVSLRKFIKRDVQTIASVPVDTFEFLERRDGQMLTIKYYWFRDKGVFAFFIAERNDFDQNVKIAEDVLQSLTFSNPENQETIESSEDLELDAPEEDADKSPSLLDNPFSDLRESDPYYDAILWAYSTDIIGGYPDGTVKADKEISRVELLKIIVEAILEDEIVYSNERLGFSDTDDTAWYAKYVFFAKNEGIVKGYADKTFKPGNTVNAAETLKMVYLTLDVETDAVDGEWFERYKRHAVMHEILYSNEIEMDKPLSRKDVLWIIWKLHTFLHPDLANDLQDDGSNENETIDIKTEPNTSVNTSGVDIHKIDVNEEYEDLQADINLYTNVRTTLYIHAEGLSLQFDPTVVDHFSSYDEALELLGTYVQSAKKGRLSELNRKTIKENFEIITKAIDEIATLLIDKMYEGY